MWQLIDMFDHSLSVICGSWLTCSITVCHWYVAVDWRVRSQFVIDMWQLIDVFDHSLSLICGSWLTCSITVCHWYVAVDWHVRSQFASLVYEQISNSVDVFSDQVSVRRSFQWSSLCPTLVSVIKSLSDARFSDQVSVRRSCTHRQWDCVTITDEW